MSDLGNKQVFSENLKYYMTLNNKDRNKICEDLKLNYSTVRDWTNGRAYPRIDKIEMLANYFGIQKSDLIEDNKDKSILSSSLRNDMLLENYISNLSKNELQRELLTNCLMLNDKYANIINEQVEYYLTKQEQEEIQEEFTQEEYTQMMSELKKDN